MKKIVIAFLMMFVSVGAHAAYTPGSGGGSSSLGTSTSAASPSISGDLTSGLFTPAASTVAVTTAGVERLRVGSNGYVSIGTTSPVTSLDLSAKTDSVALPAGTTGQRPTTGVNGMIRYNASIPAIEAYVNSAWTSLGSGGTPGGSSGQIQYNNAGAFGGLTAQGVLSNAFSFPLSTTTYPLGYMTATTTNASGTDPAWSFAIRASTSAGPGALQNGTETSTCSGGNTAFGSFAMNALTGNQCFYEASSYAQLGNGVQNVAVGTGAMAGINISGCTTNTGAGSFNTAVGGYITMNSITCGQKNTAIGEANMSGLTTGSNNAVVGVENMNVIASGAASYNAVLGSDSAQRLTGSQNVIIGGNTAQQIGASSYNNYIGFNAGGNMVGGGGADYNIALGAFALAGSGTPSNNTGVNNVAIGTAALIATTSASSNVAVGYQAGNKITTGGSNTVIGNQVATSNLTTGSNNILIGTSSATDTPSTSTSNWMNIGNAIYGTNLKNASNTGGVTQLAIGTGLTNVPNAAVLDLSSNTTAANSSLILPVGTTGARPATGVNGMLRYNSDTPTVEAYVGSTWTALGSGGGGSSVAVRGSHSNLKGVWASNTTATWTANQVAVTTSGGTPFIATSYSCTINTAATVGAVTGLDTGTLANSTWYNVYAIYNGTTSSCQFSLSASAPTLVSGYTYYARIGTFYNGSGGTIPGFTQYDRWTQYKVGSNLSALPNIFNAGGGAIGSISTPTWVSTSIATSVPPTADAIRVQLTTGAVTTNTAMVAPNNSFGAFSSVSNPPPCYVNNSSNVVAPAQCTLNLETTQVMYVAANTSTYGFTVGYEDNL